MTYKLNLEKFEGPLDLLLYLIKKNDIDVCDIPISEVTEQYLQYIEMMKILDLEIVGEFLVMAATLLQIKSRMLLPPDPNQQKEEEDPRDELVRKLQEYKLFKEVAERLKEREAERQRLYPRGVNEEERKELEEGGKEIYFEASLFDLISAFTKTLERLKQASIYEIVKEDFTVEDKIHEILHLLVEKETFMLEEFFGRSRSKMEMVVSFMAILELTRLKEVRLAQKRMFAEVIVMRNKENVVPATGA